MSYFMNDQQKINDIIFADRNKEYGAYAIRSEYGHTVLKSLFCMAFGVASLAVVAWYLNQDPVQNLDVAGQLRDSIYVIPFNPPVPEAAEPSEPKKGSAKPAESSSAKNSTQIVDSLLVETVTITAITSSTAIETATNEPGVESTTVTTRAMPTFTTPPTETVRNNYEVDSEPLFEGGLKALYRFVSANLKYPDRANDAGKGGTVYVKFVVDQNGKIGSLRVLNSLGYGMDEEALRVVGMIPDFKAPAKIRGEAVKMYYQLPINFTYR